MSTPSGDSVRDEIRENALVMGNPVKDTNKIAVTSANPLYQTAAGVLASTSPIPVTVTSAQATTVALLDITGTSSVASGGGTMIQTLVSAAGGTTFTIAAYARVTVTDGGGNITAGGYYIPLYTIA